MTPTARLPVRVQPGARSEGVVRWEGGVLYLRVKAPPVEGKANLAVERLVAALAGVPPASVRVVHGAGGRSKLVEVAGLTAEELQQRLAVSDS